MQIDNLPQRSSQQDLDVTAAAATLFNVKERGNMPLAFQMSEDVMAHAARRKQLKIG